jgi:hypothetical protein
MALPIILGIAAAGAAIAGAASGVHGAVKMKEANDTMKSADSCHKDNIAAFERQNKITSEDMDELGKIELEILAGFEDFAQIIEIIQNKPKFIKYSKEGVDIPEYNAEDLKKVSVGAGILLGGMGGAAAGTAGGFAAAGAAYGAVMALGTASTGTAIASLSGAAAANATLAALGGGALAAGGGGIALGTTLLSAATFGVGLLVGGVVFNITGSKLSDKADEAWAQMNKAEKEINEICSYMKKLSGNALKFKEALTKVNAVYIDHRNKLAAIVYDNRKTDWAVFSAEEKLITENTVLLVSLLYNMCKVQLVLASGSETEINRVNSEAISRSISDADKFLAERGLAKKDWSDWAELEQLGG